MHEDLADERHSVFDQKRLVVQRVFFGAPFPEAPNDLYAQATKGVVVQERERALIEPHARLSTNTFFGRFPASYWQRSAEVAQAELSVNAKGSGRISIRVSYNIGIIRTVATVTINDTQHEQVRLRTPIDRFTDGEALWLEASTDETALILEAAGWSVTKPERSRPAALGSCTCNDPDGTGMRHAQQLDLGSTGGLCKVAPATLTSCIVHG
jgi:galactofuranosylgalactofuranosylrhamnosyl-N-acetylglucosaminyl-diphospho-decaprenol beta-1,5/1,6-galactofuranosyltransferase